MDATVASMHVCMSACLHVCMVLITRMRARSLNSDELGPLSCLSLQVLARLVHMRRRIRRQGILELLGGLVRGLAT